MKKLIFTLLFFIPILLFGQLPCPDTVCVGDIVTYSVVNTPGSTYNWNLLPGGPLIPTVNSQTLTWNTAGNFTLNTQETNSAGCVGPVVSCIITVIDVVALINPIGPFCEGDAPLQLIGNPLGGTFTGPFTTPGGIFNPSTPGTYNITYTYTNANGCTDTYTITITVNPLPNTTPITHN